MMKLLVGILFLVSIGWAAETAIYVESFNDTGPLNEKKVIRGDRFWTAGEAFQADGTVIAEPQYTSATLPFYPQPNRTYILEARVIAEATPSSHYGDWIAFGYAHGQSVKDSAGNRFTTPSERSSPLCTGKAWAYVRPVFDRPDGGNYNEVMLSGTSPAGKFQAHERRSDLKLRIVLETTPPWSVTWYARTPSEREFKTIVPNTRLIETDITSVGFAKSGATAIGRVDNFTLKVVGEVDEAELNKTRGPVTRTETNQPAVKQQSPGNLPKMEAPLQPPPEKVDTLGLIIE